MMKKFFCSALLFLSWELYAQEAVRYSPLASAILAQQSTARDFVYFPPFQKVQVKYDTELKGNYSQFQLKTEVLKQLLTQKATTIEIEIPLSAQQKVHLLLVGKTLFTADAQIEVGDDKEKQQIPLPQAVYYQGIVKEDALHSVATISVFEHELNGVFVYEGKTYNLGKLQTTTSKTDYCLYATDALLFPVQRTCKTATQSALSSDISQSELSPNGVNNCLRMYYECDYQFYLKKNSNTTDVVNYVASLFNVVNTLYNNESVSTAIAKIFVWTKNDGYASATLNDALDAFGAHTQNNFNGNLAHLISGYNNSLGGLAWLGVLCVPYDANLNAGPYAVSRLLGSFSAYPTFSWDAEVITHETGHNIGSHHTHWCGWVGGALDNCYTTEGGCAAGAAPSNGGTIMSYCHLVSAGINFANGFGTQPGDVVRNAVSNAACLTSCASICTANLVISTNISTTTATKYEASGIISATNTLASGTNVVYDAGQEIILQPGFLATSGSTFLTQLDGCGNLRESETLNETQTQADFLSSVLLFPNPVSSYFSLNFTLNQTQQVEISLWNMIGQKITVLQTLQRQEAGAYSLDFEANGLVSGMYLIKVGNETQSKVMKFWKW